DTEAGAGSCCCCKQRPSPLPRPRRARSCAPPRAASCAQATGRQGERLAPERAVLPSVAEVDPKPDHEPHEQPDPCVQGERQHETDTREDAEQRDEWHEGRAKRSLEIRSRMPQDPHAGAHQDEREQRTNRKSTRLNSSHVAISYAVFCLKKKKKTQPEALGSTATDEVPTS